MSIALLPTTGEIREAFSQAVGSVGGTVTNAYCQADALFLRATFSETDQIRRGDTVRAGVALRTHRHDVAVHPYVLRKVCSNGAIWAQSVDSRIIKRVELSSSSEDILAVLEEVREAVAASVRGPAFNHAVLEMRGAMETSADFNLLLNMWPTGPGVGEAGIAELLHRQQPVMNHSMTDVFNQILMRFSREHGRTRYDLMNAVTSVARDTEDPELKWRLEELGGGVPAFVPPRIQPGDAAAEVVAEVVAEVAAEVAAETYVHDDVARPTTSPYAVG